MGEKARFDNQPNGGLLLLACLGCIMVLLRQTCEQLPPSQTSVRGGRVSQAGYARTQASTNLSGVTPGEREGLTSHRVSADAFHA